MPAVRILDNMPARPPTSTASASRKWNPARAKLFPGSLLVHGSQGLPIDLPGTHTTEPAFRPSRHLGRCFVARGSQLPRLYGGPSPAPVLTTHPDRSAEVAYVRAGYPYAENQEAGSTICPAEHKEAGRRAHPLANLGSPAYSAYCRRCWPERVSIRDLSAILEGIAEAVGHTRRALYYRARTRALSRPLCHANLSPGGYLPILAMVAGLGTGVRESIIGQGRGSPARPWRLRNFSSSSPACATLRGIQPEERGARAAGPVRRSGLSFARSSSVSAPRPWSCRRTKSTLRIRLRTLGRCDGDAQQSTY